MIVEVTDAKGNLARKTIGLAEMSRHLIATLTGEADGVESVSFSLDGTTLAFTSVVNEWTIGSVTQSSIYVKLWDLVNRQKITTLTGQTS